jgi:predicted NAD-dependent protein-ADP-ribosyltransferase YbiA (DUF1768 family)
MDGQTHINIYSKGKTELGRLLSNWAYSPIRIDGKVFCSIEAYWYWLGVDLPDNHPEKMRLAMTSGFKAKEMGRNLKKKYGLKQVDDFEELIKKALRVKIESWLNIEKLLKESTLPFDHYYEYGGKRVDAGYAWLVAEWEKIREELKGRSSL